MTSVVLDFKEIARRRKLLDTWGNVVEAPAPTRAGGTKTTFAFGGFVWWTHRPGDPMPKEVAGKNIDVVIQAAGGTKSIIGSHPGQDYHWGTNGIFALAIGWRWSDG